MKSGIWIQATLRFNLANSNVSAGLTLGSYDQAVRQTRMSFDFEPTNDGLIVRIEECQMSNQSKDKKYA